MTVPKLRFPEFWDAGEWEKDELGKISLFINERIPLDQLTLKNYVSTENILPDYEGLVIASKLPSSGTASRFKTNDVLISNIRPYLKKVCLASKDGGASNDVIVVRAKSKVSYQYLSFILKNDAFIEYVMRGAKGVKMPRGDIFLMKKYPLAYPSKQEQQKIADCLSSIDDLITAETQKLDTLKAHKKGLMQQLFPAEGETLPKLRFPEFRDSGEWGEYQFGELIKVNSGKGFKASEYCKHGIRLLQIENVGYGVTKWSDNAIYLPQKYSIEYPELVLREGDIVLALNRPITNNELKIAQIQKKDPPSLLYQRVGKLELLSDSVVEDFVFHICRTFIKNFVVKQSIGSDQPFISVTTLYMQAILIPSPDEQQKIADCLSSLDEQIAAKTKKIDTLKNHKKGLMQQLFPSVEEVKG
jgi:type I restriction enzyme S subunit